MSHLTRPPQQSSNSSAYLGVCIAHYNTNGMVHLSSVPSKQYSMSGFLSPKLVAGTTWLETHRTYRVERVARALSSFRSSSQEGDPPSRRRRVVLWCHSTIIVYKHFYDGCIFIDSGMKS